MTRPEQPDNNHGHQSAPAPVPDPAAEALAALDRFDADQHPPINPTDTHTGTAHEPVIPEVNYGQTEAEDDLFHTYTVLGAHAKAQKAWETDLDAARPYPIDFDAIPTYQRDHITPEQIAKLPKDTLLTAPRKFVRSLPPAARDAWKEERLKAQGNLQSVEADELGRMLDTNPLAHRTISVDTAQYLPEDARAVLAKKTAFNFEGEKPKDKIIRRVINKIVATEVKGSERFEPGADTPVIDRSPAGKPARAPKQTPEQKRKRYEYAREALDGSYAYVTASDGSEQRPAKDSLFLGWTDGEIIAYGRGKKPQIAEDRGLPDDPEQELADDHWSEFKALEDAAYDRREALKEEMLPPEPPLLKKVASAIGGAIGSMSFERHPDAKKPRAEKATDAQSNAEVLPGYNPDDFDANGNPKDQKLRTTYDEEPTTPGGTTENELETTQQPNEDGTWDADIVEEEQEPKPGTVVAGAGDPDDPNKNNNIEDDFEQLRQNLGLTPEKGKKRSLKTKAQALADKVLVYFGLKEDDNPFLKSADMEPVSEKDPNSLTLKQRANTSINLLIINTLALIPKLGKNIKNFHTEIGPDGKLRPNKESKLILRVVAGIGLVATGALAMGLTKAAIDIFSDNGDAAAQMANSSTGTGGGNFFDDVKHAIDQAASSSNGGAHTTTQTTTEVVTTTQAPPPVTGSSTASQVVPPASSGTTQSTVESTTQTTGNSQTTTTGTTTTGGSSAAHTPDTIDQTPSTSTTTHTPDTTTQQPGSTTGNTTPNPAGTGNGQPNPGDVNPGQPNQPNFSVESHSLNGKSHSVWSSSEQYWKDSGYGNLPKAQMTDYTDALKDWRLQKMGLLNADGTENVLAIARLQAGTELPMPNPAELAEIIAKANAT